MLYYKNTYSARRNQIKILSILQGEGSPFRFNDIKQKAELTQNTISKWIKHFQEEKYIEKVGDNKRKEYQITKRGISEFRKLLVKENAEKTLSSSNLIDSLQFGNKAVKTEQGIYSCQVSSPVSAILNDEKRQAIEKEISEKVLPVLLKLYNEQEVLSGATLIRFCKKK